MSVVGLVFVRLAVDADHHQVVSKCQQAATLIGSGRTVAVAWDVPHAWRASSPIEAWVTEAILGLPQARGESDEDPFAFFANLVVRCYSESPSDPVRTTALVLFRRQGDPAYRRRQDPDAPVQADTLDTAAYSFTRDIANNTWHLKEPGADEEMVARLSRLLCWSDEQVVDLTSQEVDRSDLRERDTSDLVGVATKSNYAWRKGSTRSEQMNLLDDE